MVHATCNELAHNHSLAHSQLYEWKIKSMNVDGRNFAAVQHEAC